MSDNGIIISNRRQSDARAMLRARPVNQLIRSASQSRRNQIAIADPLARHSIEIQ